MSEPAGDPTAAEGGWQSAASLAGGLPDVDAARAVRRVRRRRVTLLVAVVLITLVGGVLLGLYLPRDSVRGRSDPPRAQLWVGYGLAVVGFALAVVGWVRAWRRGAFRPVWASPSAALDRKDRKWLLGRIRADETVPAERSAVAVELANRLVRMKLLLPFYAGLMVFWLSEVLTTSSSLLRLLMPVGLAVLAVGLMLVTKDARRARRWLDHHPHEGQRV